MPPDGLKEKGDSWVSSPRCYTILSVGGLRKDRSLPP